jgi:putative DNA primase/helicase
MNDAAGIPFAPELPDVGPRLALRVLADVQPRQVRWLVPGLIPLRTLTLVAGVGGLGKSTLLAGIAARVSTGEIGDAPGNVVLVSFEDTAAEVLRPRVEAAGGDLTRVHEVVVDRLDIDPVCLPRDVEELATLTTSIGARLLVIDPVVAALETSLDAHKDQHVRVVLAQLAALAEETDCAIAMVGHLNKTPSREAYLRIGGSVAFFNAARSVVLVTEDKVDTDMRLVSQSKANYSRTRPVERHRIEEVILPGTLDPETGAPITTSRMAFVEIADDVDAADLLAPRDAGVGATRERQATKFLVGELAGGEWNESAPIKERAEAEGITERTLQRAKQDLGVEDERRGYPSVTYWRLSRATPVPQNLAPLEEPHNHAESSSSRETVAPVAPVAPRTGSDGATRNGSTLDPELDRILAAHLAGHITTGEALELERIHKFVAGKA